MRTTNLKTVYLTDDEFKEALVDFLIKHGHVVIAEHLQKNAYEMEWVEPKGWSISIDGELDS